MVKFNYSIENKLKGQNDFDMCEMIHEYERGYISDIMNEIGESFISIYTSNIFDNAYIFYTEEQYEELSSILYNIEELEEIIEKIDELKYTRLKEILDKETITLEELEYIEEHEDIKKVVNCGNSGKRIDCILYTVYSIYGEEEEVLLKVDKNII